MAGKELLTANGLCYGIDIKGVTVLKEPVRTTISISSDNPLQIVELKCPCYDQHTGLCNASMQQRKTDEITRRTCVYVRKEDPGRPLFVYNANPNAILEHKGLTPRESEVLALAAQGLEHEKIADLLNTSSSTTRHQLAKSYRRLKWIGITNQTEAVIAFGLKADNKEIPDKLKERVNTLSHTEKKTLAVSIYEGRATKKAISGRLTGKWQTVRAHNSNVRRKLGVDTTRESYILYAKAAMDSRNSSLINGSNIKHVR